MTRGGRCCGVFFGAFFVGRKGWDIGGIGGLEEGTLPQLRFRLLVVNLCRTTTAEGLSEAGVIDAVADGAELFDDRWLFDFGHCSYRIGQEVAVCLANLTLKTSSNDCRRIAEGS